MNVIIFSGGQVEDGFFVREAIKSTDLIIAADNGAESAFLFKVKPNIVIGDLDSINKKILNQVQDDVTIEIVESKPQKDETDTQLAVDVAIKKGATEITILGGVLGNRLDHVLANVFLSDYISRHSGERSDSRIPIKNGRDSGQARITFINGNQKTWIETGPTTVQLVGTKGDLLSLLPLSEKVEKIKTENLQYPLYNDTMYFGIPRGISNVFLQEECSVFFTKGKLLFVQTKQNS